MAASAAALRITDEDIAKSEPEKLVSPRNPTPHESVFLSNIDLAVSFIVETIFFFEADPEKTASVSEISRTLKAALTKLLVPYYFLAGRFVVNQESGRSELLCNNAGALFVNAKSRLGLMEIGDLALPNPTFRQFVHRHGIHTSLAERPVFTVQVTEFACGGFAIGFVTNHGVLDGVSAGEMFQNLAAICRGDDLKIRTIYNDRTCFKARNPPQIKFPHKEYIKPNPSLVSAFTTVNKPFISSSLASPTAKYVHKIIPFTPQMLSALKQKANTHCSTFQAILAHVWRARTRAVFQDPGEVSTVLFAVDIRSKTSPALPNGFAGNAVITASAAAKVADLAEKPFSFCVDMVKRGIERVTDEYIRSAIDWLEVHRGIPASCNGNFYVSAWWKLPFNELDFGFGKPIHGGPIAYESEEFVLLLSQGRKGENGGSINVWICMQENRMESFMADILRI